MMNVKNMRIAWLLPVAWFYWQPAISKLTQTFPGTRIFTALWPGFARGFENTLNVESVGQWQVLRLTDEAEGYGPSFTYVPLSVLWPLLKFRPHLIFSNSFGIWTLLALLLKPILRWRVVIAYEGSSPGVDFRHSPLRLTLRQGMVKLADAVISNSQVGRNYLVDILKAKPERAFAHPYEVPAAESLLISDDSSDMGIKPHIQLYTQPIFLFVGRIRQRKGLRSLLDACTLLKQQGYHRFTLLVVGDGEQREELQALSNHYHLDDCVHWLGRVDYDKVNTYFRQADVFVLPTYEDTWGVVISEAMLFGKAILCSSAAGASELVVHGTNGYVFNPQEPTELAELMKEFIKHPEQAQKMGEQSQNLMDLHTPQVAAQFFTQVIETVMHTQFTNLPSQSAVHPSELPSELPTELSVRKS